MLDWGGGAGREDEHGRQDKGLRKEESDKGEGYEGRKGEEIAGEKKQETDVTAAEI